MKIQSTKNEWPFGDLKNVAVFTTTQVMRLRQPILHVSHDDEDGAWQFHTGTQQVSAGDAMIVALSEMVDHDPSICELADLPCGWFAERESVGSPWRRAQRNVMDSLWGTVDVERWQQTPCLRGRVAVEQDVKDGRAVFYLQDSDKAGVVHVDIGLPHCAILSADGQHIPIIIIQSECAGEKHYIGYRPVSGGSGICLLFEVQLSEKPDETFYRYT